MAESTSRTVSRLRFNGRVLAELAVATTLLAGQSVEGRPLRAVRSGAASAPVKLLVVGALHGDEPGGPRVVDALRVRRPPSGVQVWTLRTANPDGARRGTRVNARGVDLNRNFPHRWARGPRGRFFPGPRAASEPETRAVQRLVRKLDPDLTVHFHQPYGFVVDTPTAPRPTLRAYARRTGLPVRGLPRYRGTAVGWQHAADPRSPAFVVELPVRGFSPARHARAVLAAGRDLVAGAAAAPEPAIRSTPIPFGTERKRQMRRYATRHYGLRTHLLRAPRVIVQHYTASTTFSSAFHTFAANTRDPELGELPGVCAHFLIDRDGTIHRLVSTKFMCRHTIGLNHRAIGIEHVGVSDRDVMGRRRQLAASLRLTRWLMDVHGIERRHVIGHAESLSSPFHHERVAALRDRTHGDFAPATMRRYRAMLR